MAGGEREDRTSRLADLAREAAERRANDEAPLSPDWIAPDAADTNSAGRMNYNPMYDIAEHPTPAVQLNPVALGCARVAVLVPALLGASGAAVAAFRRRKRRRGVPVR